MVASWLASESRLVALIAITLRLSQLDRLRVTAAAPNLDCDLGAINPIWAVQAPTRRSAPAGTIAVPERVRCAIRSRQIARVGLAPASADVRSR